MLICVTFRHEMPVDNDLSKQNIQDRYHGHNDPVAKKILNNHASTMGLAPPEDQTIVRFNLNLLENIPHTNDDRCPSS